MTTAKTDDEETLAEAHRNHRLQLALLQQRVRALEIAVGPNESHTNGWATLRAQVKELRERMWHADEAKSAVEKLRKVADALHEIFHSDD